MPPLAPAILLPPSEGKALGGEGPGWGPGDGRFGTALEGARREVVAALNAAGGGDTRLLGVGGAHLERARNANLTVVGAASLPAGERYTGVVYDHLDLAGLPRAARRRGSASLIVLSGLLGAVGIDDPTPDYRLKMGARLGELGVLARWWRPRLAPVLDAALARRVVLDLLPLEHRGAFDPPRRPTALLRIGFVERAGAAAGKAGGHDAKAAKGQLVRHLLEHGGDPRDALGRFHHARFDLSIEELV
jgi:hypothetical protein